MKRLDSHITNFFLDNGMTTSMTNSETINNVVVSDNHSSYYSVITPRNDMNGLRLFFAINVAQRFLDNKIGKVVNYQDIHVNRLWFKNDILAHYLDAKKRISKNNYEDAFILLVRDYGHTHEEVVDFSYILKALQISCPEHLIERWLKTMTYTEIRQEILIPEDVIYYSQLVRE